MSQRRVIMLALGDEVEFAVLSYTEVARSTQRGHRELAVALKLVRGGAGRGFGQPRPDLLAHLGQQLQEPALEGLGEELDPLESRLGYGRRVLASEQRMVGANRAHVGLTAQFCQRQRNRLEWPTGWQPDQAR